MSKCPCNTITLIIIQFRIPNGRVVSLVFRNGCIPPVVEAGNGPSSSEVTSHYRNPKVERLSRYVISARIVSSRRVNSSRIDSRRQVVSSCVTIVALLERTCSVPFRCLTQVSTITSKNVACVNILYDRGCTSLVITLAGCHAFV